MHVQHKWLDCGEEDRYVSLAITATAVMYGSISIVCSVWQVSTPSVFILAVFVVPVDLASCESCRASRTGRITCDAVCSRLPWESGIVPLHAVAHFDVRTEGTVKVSCAVETVPVVSVFVVLVTAASAEA